MATDIQSTTKRRTGPYRLNVDQYLRMIVDGILPPHARVELLDGLLVRSMTKNPPHSFTRHQLDQLVGPLLPADWMVRHQDSVVLGRYWRPEPDIAVVRGPNERYRQADPTTADIAFLIEVADTTYARDRGRKWRGYAAAGVPIYLIVNLPKRIVEVYSQPAGKGKKAAYEQEHVYGPEDTFPIVLGGQPIGIIAVKDILP